MNLDGTERLRDVIYLAVAGVAAESTLASSLRNATAAILAAIETREAALRTRIGELEAELREMRPVLVGRRNGDLVAYVDRALGTPKGEAKP